MTNITVLRAGLALTGCLSLMLIAGGCQQGGPSETEQQTSRMEEAGRERQAENNPGGVAAPEGTASGSTPGGTATPAQPEGK
ncbi:MAG: hypothetical protein RMJ43_02165 [Chloroherpetonaceae bacterium]|nr:hypothetical protein [Chthonomonadaceae bacterium]MDW8206613.1 hypothetical protein [Chloroherpetonaceae bacterium]